MNLFNPSRRAVRSAPVPSSGEDDFGWLMSFSDLTLLLLCFFALWYVVQSKSNASLTERAAHRAPVQQKGTVQADPAENGPAWESVREAVGKSIDDAGLDEEVKILPTGRGVVVSLMDRLSFASGRADLSPKFFSVVERVAAIARSRPELSLEVLGHTDDRPISTHEFPSNWELSAARASRVARFLVEKGVAPERVSAQGYASFHPLLPNDNDENRETNRRVEIRLYRPAGDPQAAGAGER